MNDVVILLIIAAWAVLFAGYVVLCDRVGR
jgi:hypothetical protein